MDKTKRTFTYLINLSFFVYAFILIIERVLSVVLSLVNDVDIFAAGYNRYVYSIVFVSIAIWLIFLFTYCRANIKALIKIDEELPFDKLIITSGILLLSGMVHSEYTMSIIQFVAYGILIIGILLKVIMMHKSSQNKPLLWLSFIYLVCFSMAVPVMYFSFIELHVLFHTLEAVASSVLVAIFTYLLLSIFTEKEDLFSLWPVIIMIVLDTPLIILRWNEEINWFLLIFEILTTVVFVVGFTYKRLNKKVS